MVIVHHTGATVSHAAFRNIAFEEILYSSVLIVGLLILVARDEEIVHTGRFMFTLKGRLT